MYKYQIFEFAEAKAASILIRFMKRPTLIHTCLMLFCENFMQKSSWCSGPLMDMHENTATTRIKKKRRTSKIDDKTFPRNEKQKTKKPFESS